MANKDSSSEVKADQPTAPAQESKTVNSFWGRLQAIWSNKTYVWLIGLVVAVLLIFLGAFAVLIYRFKSQNPLVYNVARLVPYPVERVNSDYVSYGRYLFYLRANQKTLEASLKAKQDSQPSPDDIKQRLNELPKVVLNTLTNRVVVEELIRQRKIKVTSKELNDFYDRLVKDSGGQAQVELIIKQDFGWTIGDLKNELRFQLAKQKLEQALMSDDNVNAQAKAKAAEVLAKLKAGGDFGDLAKQYSQDSGSAAAGGDLGTVTKGQILPNAPEFDASVEALQPGQTSDVVKTRYGYHIIKVIDKNGDQVHVAHILIKPIDVDQYLQDQTNHAKVRAFLKV